jgi:MtrB/PioB family decaheme-associated outer membrane protein
MTKSVISSRFRLSAVALACTLFVAVQARAEEENTVPPVQATVSVGLGLVDGSRADRALISQYYPAKGDSNVVGILGLDYRLRKPEPASWVNFSGENLLGDTREMHLVWKNPGDWKFTADYGELVHYDPYTVNTGMLGFGSTTPKAVVLQGGPGTGSEFELKTKRTGLGVGFSRRISDAVQFEVDLKSENKEGSRLFGIGMNCFSSIATCGTTTSITTGWALLMMPEPISANHSQIEARVNYARDKLRLSAGYYGSFYRNDYSTLNPGIPGALNNPVGTTLALSGGLQSLLSQSVALPPDNQAHQIDINGSYAFTDKTQGTFRLGYASATQNSDFIGDGLTSAPAGVANLGGKVTTTSVRFGVNSRPLPKLSLLADLRYDDKDDQTPVAYYNYIDGVSRYTNRTMPDRKTRAKLQASWQFSGGYRGTVGADYESIDRGVFTATSAAAGISALRQQTEETNLRADLRRQMTEDLSGSVSLSSSRRSGSNWLRDNSGLGVTEVSNPTDASSRFTSDSIFMPTLADRKRDKVKIFADWQPSKKLAFQFSAEEGKDHYSSSSSYGLQDSRVNNYGVDFVYAESFNWNFNGFLSQGTQTFNQSRYAGYVMAFENTSINFGLGFTGKISSNFEIGGNLTFSDDKSVYAQKLDAFAGADSVALLAATGGLPDVVYRQTALKLYGNYALDKKSSIRVDLVHQRANVNDWAWNYNGVPFSYSDGTTLTQKQSQSVGFIGITYIYRLP